MPDAQEASGYGTAAGLMNDWKYTIGVQIFQQSPVVPGQLAALNLNDYPLDHPIPGLLFQAARTLLGLAQDDLTGSRTQPKVGEGQRAPRESGPVLSRKYLTDLENGTRGMTTKMSAKLRMALEAKGARFVVGDGCIGVVAVMERVAFEARPRALRKRAAGGGSPAPATPGKAARGRQRVPRGRGTDG